METPAPTYRLPFLKRSYRTYEEWKQIFYNLIQKEGLGSYRTYEEWKHVFHTSTPHLFFSSYRTYEEWKQKIFYG